MSGMPDIPEVAIEAAAKVIYEAPADSLSCEGYEKAPSHIQAIYRHEARLALAAARPHLLCSCPHISDVDDYCPQHGRDA